MASKITFTNFEEHKVKTGESLDSITGWKDAIQKLQCAKKEGEGNEAAAGE